jgi:hypothetical protein
MATSSPPRHPSHLRPPKPVPFGGGIDEKKSAEAEDHEREVVSGLEAANEVAAARISSMDISERSRDSLRKNVQSRRTSLTAREHLFLEELCVHGNEFEVQLALLNLNDSDLFFEPNAAPTVTSPSAAATSSLSSEGWPMDTITLGREFSGASIEPIGSLKEISSSSEHGTGLGSNNTTNSTTAATCGSSSSLGGEPLGSERRQLLLEQRRNSQVHLFGNLWKAHDTGLAISTTASRRSVLRRNSHQNSQSNQFSMNYSSVNSSISLSRRDLFQRQYRHDEIFRSMQMNETSENLNEGTEGNNEGTNSNINTANSGDWRFSWSSQMQSASERDDIFRGSMEDSKSDNNHTTTRRKSWAGRKDRETSISSSSGTPTPRSSLKMPPKPVLRRMMSDSSRKSVSFSRNVPLPGAPPKRSQNRRATSVGESNTGSWNLKDEATPLPTSPPRTKYGRASRSTSESSIPLLHHAGSVHSINTNVSSTGAVRSDSQSSIPPLHHAHSVHSINTNASTTGAVRSESMSSIPPLHHAHSLHSINTNNNVNGAHGRNSSISSIPSLALRHPHPVRSDSIRSTAASSVSGWDGDSFTDDNFDGRDPSETGMRDAKTKLSDSNAIHWPDSIPSKVVIPSKEPVHKIQPAEHIMARPVLMREASENAYQGEGIEVANWAGNAPNSSLLEKESSHTMQTTGSLVSFGNGDSSTMRSSNSFDETMSYERISSIFRRSIPQSLSDEDMAGIFLGSSKAILRHRETVSLKDLKPMDDDASWQMDDDDDDEDYYDAWKVIEDEYDNGYGGGGTLSFRILGTSVNDLGAHPHVMSPPLMESLLNFVPGSKAGENYWMKYSLVRDGASLHTFLQYARGTKYSILAIETVDGEVFGAFTGEPWRKNWNYFGSQESFLWKMRHSRKEKSHSIIDQAHVESEIDVFPFTGENTCIQLCTHDKIAVGGGAGVPKFESEGSSPHSSSPVKDHEWGFGLTVHSDMLNGTSSPCATFGSPSLSNEHSDGSVFEIINLELWTLTPCMTLEEAEKLELGKLFLEQNRRG